jgi:hypothetical protein
MRRLLFVFALLVLSACGGSTAATIQPALSVAPSLDGLILQDGDLPAKFGTFTANIPWRIYPDIPTNGTPYYFEIYQGERTNEVGHISVVSYSVAVDAERAWRSILTEMEVETPSDDMPVGEWGKMHGPTPSWDNSDVLFLRCTTVVHVTAPVATSQLKAYAEQIDGRIHPVVCQG